MSFLFNLFNLCNIVSCPTFGNSTLDKFFCAQHTASDYSAVTAPPLGNALHAHQIVFISRCGDTAIVRSSLRKVYDLRASHVLAYRERILATDWSTLLHCQDVEKCVSCFYDLLYSALATIPVSYVYVTPKTKPWITPVITDLINKRWAAYKARNFTLYCHYKGKVKNEIIKSKKIWSNKMCKSSKGVWSVVNDVRGKDDVRSSDHLLSLFSNPVEAVETINSNFSRVFTSSNTFPHQCVNKKYDFEICSMSSIFSLLSRLRTDKACGSDGVNPIFLKLCAIL